MDLEKALKIANTFHLFKIINLEMPHKLIEVFDDFYTRYIENKKIEYKDSN
jgi:hypothetical protein